MPSAPKIRASEGTPEALPKGAAKQMNDTLAATPGPPEAQVAATPQEAGVQFVQSTRAGVDKALASTGDGEEDDFLLQDPTPIDRTIPDTLRRPIPDDVLVNLRYLTEASRDPSAPPELTLLVQLLAHHLEQG